MWRRDGAVGFAIGDWGHQTHVSHLSRAGDRGKDPALSRISRACLAPMSVIIRQPQNVSGGYLVSPEVVKLTTSTLKLPAGIYMWHTTTLMLHNVRNRTKQREMREFSISHTSCQEKVGITRIYCGDHSKSSEGHEVDLEFWPNISNPFQTAGWNCWFLLAFHFASCRWWR